MISYHLLALSLRRILAVACLVAAIQAALGADQQPGNPRPLRVGVAPVSPPMIFKEGRTMAGIEADLAHALGARLGRPVTFVELKWDALIEALEDDRVDILMSSMSVTPARRFRVLFSEPYLRISQMMLVRAQEQYRYGLLANALADTTIGLKKGTTGDLLTQQEFPRAKRKYFASGKEAAEALRKKKIDLFIDDSPMIYYLASLNESAGLVPAQAALSDEYLAWGMRRTDSQLCEAANAFLKDLKTSGELEKILHRWLPRFP